MGHWNHRVLFDGTQYWVGEVYYDDAGTPFAHTGSDSCPLAGWETLNGLVETTRHVGRATFKPVLDIRGGNYTDRKK